MFNEQDRFYEIANLADQVVEPGSPEWQAYLEAQLENGVVFNPTLNIYSAGRDLMRARNADWHAKYTLPSLYQFFQPSRVTHGSSWYDWTTEKAIARRRFYGPYMRLMHDYQNLGGLCTVGSDPAYSHTSWVCPYLHDAAILQE